MLVPKTGVFMKIFESRSMLKLSSAEWMTFTVCLCGELMDTREKHFSESKNA